MSDLSLSIEGNNRVYRKFCKLTESAGLVENPSDGVGDGVTSLALRLQQDTPADCETREEQRAYHEGLVVGYLTAKELLVDALDS